jgi:hypothetical protein
MVKTAKTNPTVFFATSAVRSTYADERPCEGRLRVEVAFPG